MRVLVFSAHPDDEVLGPGATLARLAAQGADVHVAIVTDGCSAQYPDRPELVAEKKACAARALDALGGGTLHFGDFPDMKLDTLPLVTVNAFLEKLVGALEPNIVFTHHPMDLNRDHRIVAEASVIACRPSSSHRISSLLSYEVLGVTNFGGTQLQFRPTIFYDVSAHRHQKLAALRHYDVELRPFPHPRSLEAIDAQGQYYGALCGSEWAEAFQPLRETR